MGRPRLSEEEKLARKAQKIAAQQAAASAHQPSAQQAASVGAVASACPLQVLAAAAEEAAMTQAPQTSAAVPSAGPDPPAAGANRQCGKRSAAAVRLSAAGGSRAGAGRPRSSVLKRFEFSTTISLEGEDLDVCRVKPLLDDFLRQNCERAYLTAERGELEHHLHLQGLIVVTTTSSAAFKSSLIRAMDFADGTPPNLQISLKKLLHKGLHTQAGIIGYSLKDKDEPHFMEIVCHNVTDEEKEEGKMQYLLHGKIAISKKRVALNQSNLINKMMVYLKYNTSNVTSFSADPFNLLLVMMNSGHYLLESRWIYDRNGLSLSRLKALWKANVFPERLDRDDLLKIMFPRDTDLGEGGKSELQRQSAGLYDTEEDAFSRSEFTRYFEYDKALLQPAVKRRCLRVRQVIPGPHSLSFKDSVREVRYEKAMESLRASMDDLQNDPMMEEDDDFDLLSSTTTAFDARREMLDQALKRADAVLFSDRVVSGNPFKSGDEFVPLVQASD